MAQHHYVYAILSGEATVPEGLAGLNGSRVRSVPYRELSAATSLIEPSGLEPTTENVLLHESIVERLRQSGPALPVRFGTVLASMEAVERSLAQHYDPLTSDLDRIGDKVEFGLTVLLPTPLIVDEGGPARDDAAPPVDGSQATEGPGARYLQARLTEHRHEMALREKAEALARSLDAALCRGAIDHRQTVLPSPRIAIRAAYLLQPSGIDAFRQAFEKARAQHSELRFLLSGPWPPYSFVTVTGTKE